MRAPRERNLTPWGCWFRNPAKCRASSPLAPLHPRWDNFGHLSDRRGPHSRPWCSSTWPPLPGILAAAPGCIAGARARGAVRPARSVDYGNEADGGVAGTSGTGKQIEPCRSCSHPEPAADLAATAAPGTRCPWSYNRRCRNIGNDSRTRSTVSSETSTARTLGSNPRSASTTPIGSTSTLRPTDTGGAWHTPAT
jgi:hypothetical protein